ncbi:MAG: hypothetical protein WDN49_15140 [Acetobacteraceae bacterium]
MILTPHIGGSTSEAQERIGTEVAHKLIEYSDAGSTVGAVNFPQVQLPLRPAATRYVHIHHNVPGMLGRVNSVFSGRRLNYCRAIPADGWRPRLRGGRDADGAGLRRRAGGAARARRHDPRAADPPILAALPAAAAARPLIAAELLATGALPCR